MALVQQHINDIDLTDVAMLLELLTDLGADGGYGDVEGVHCLDFGGLYIDHRSVSKYQLKQWSDIVKTMGMLVGETNRSEPFSVGLANSSFGICPVDGYFISMTLAS